MKMLSFRVSQGDRIILSTDSELQEALALINTQRLPLLDLSLSPQVNSYAKIPPLQPGMHLNPESSELVSEGHESSRVCDLSMPLEDQSHASMDQDMETESSCASQMSSSELLNDTSSSHHSIASSSSRYSMTSQAPSEMSQQGIGTGYTQLVHALRLSCTPAQAAALDSALQVAKVALSRTGAPASPVGCCMNCDSLMQAAARERARRKEVERKLKEAIQRLEALEGK